MVDNPKDAALDGDDEEDDDAPAGNRRQARGRNQGQKQNRDQGGRGGTWQKLRGSFGIMDAAALLLPGLSSVPLLKSWASESAEDGIGEQLVRVMGRDRMKNVAQWLVDDVLMQRPAVRDIILSIDPQLLTVPIRVLIGTLLRRWLYNNQTAWMLADELAQEVQQRIQDIRSGAVTVGGVEATASPQTEAKKAEAKKVQAVAFLVKYPLIEARITGLFTNQAERLAVKTRVRDALDTEDEAKYLARPVSKLVGGKPAFESVTHDAAGNLTPIGTRWAIERKRLLGHNLDEHARIHSLLCRKVETAAQLTALLAKHDGSDVPKEIFEQRLNALPELDGMDKDRFLEDLLFIEDSKGTSRVRDFFNGVVREIKKVDRIIPEAVEDEANSLAVTMNNLADELFGAL